MSHDARDEQNPGASQNPSFEAILEQRYSRRHVMQGGLAMAIATTFGGLALIGCSDDENGGNKNPNTNPNPTPRALGFAAVAKSLADRISLAAGYTARVLYATGDPIAAGVAAYSNAGTESAASFTQRSGDHHDGMYYFGMGANDAPQPNSSDRALLCINHEVVDAFIHANGATAAPRPADEVLKEMNGHGVSVIEIQKDGSGQFQIVQNSSLNRRITARTEMRINGPVRGSSFVRTRYSTGGTQVQGTFNNCANGFTPWSTYTTCEENWAGYFARAAGDDTQRTPAQNASLDRYGIDPDSSGRYDWSTVTPATDQTARFNCTVTGTSLDGTDDFRNEPFAHGWVVEIDPFSPSSMPRKRTALGRLAHEGAWPGRFIAGQPIVIYMGDDNRDDHIYKFVSAENWDPADASNADRLSIGDKYLDSGTLYTAVFNADGTGTWRPLVFGQNNLVSSNPNYPFANQADVLVNARIAARELGATRMDRPEWAAIHPDNGEVYFTLTNTRLSNRPVAETDPANPRAYRDFKGTREQDGNPNGHIIRFREAGSANGATTFTWDIYLFGAQADAPADTVNLSGLSNDNDFSSPDGLWFSRPGSDGSGLIWIQTDDGAYADVTNCMMLAGIPGTVGDGASRMITNTLGVDTRTVQTFVGRAATSDNLRRFLVGPVDCEITGIDSTPDGRTLFVNVQHPGESYPGIADPSSNWPNNNRDATQPGAAGQRPRSATLVITKNDGGVVGI